MKRPPLPSIVTVRSGITLQRAIIGALAIAMLAGFVPASIVLDHRLGNALEDRARADLMLAPHILADRMSASSDAMMMHAKELSHVPSLAIALAASDRAGALRSIQAERANLAGSEPVVISASGASWAGPAVSAALIAETREGRMPVAVERSGPMIHRIALAPVLHDNTWVGATGLATPFDDRLAALLASLTRSGVIIATTDGALTGTTIDSVASAALLADMRSGMVGGSPRTVPSAAGPLLAVTAPLPGSGIVIFSRSLGEELAVLPELRRVAALSALGALLVALLLGAALASRVGRPVRELSDAASALAEERFTVPLPTSRIREVSRVSATFDTMRRTLAARLEELRNTNEALTDRNARLTALQADLMQRDRLASTGRLVTQLAHEIRNPVANLRNCLELIRRRVVHDADVTEFADLAIDELLRMHELAEQMLDLNRPREGGVRDTRLLPIAEDVAKFANLGSDGTRARITVRGDPAAHALIEPDALKQVLTNLVQNAREAFTSSPSRRDEAIEVVIGTTAGAWIEVRDNGPGIAETIAAKIFDPFFTTKNAVHGVGLGLFVAEGLVRGAGGRMSANNRSGGGACFRIDYPPVSAQHARAEAPTATSPAPQPA